MRKVFLLCFCLSLQVQAFGKTTFSSRVNHSLMISGMECEGGELSERSERLCQRGQWLIAFNRDAAFVAKLRKESVCSKASFFEIVPKDSMTHQERKMVGRFWVRVGFDQIPEFMSRGVNSYPEL